MCRPARTGRLPTIGRIMPNRAIYPYRLMNELDFDWLAERTFQAVVLENDWLQLTVLPELGGRLHRAIYKPSGYDLFYHNDAIRLHLIASRGAWYAGGVEFNFPVSHSLTTCSGVDWATERYADGSAAVIVANTDRCTQMRWQVAIRLHADRSAIHFRTRLFNRTAWPQRYYYWLNAAVPQGEQIRYHFSASRLIGHTQDVDGVRTRLDSYPMLRNGSDARSPARLNDVTSIFMLDNETGFFGYYDTHADLGFVRSAPVRNVPGNKIWSWGDTDYGRRFNRRLVPPGGQFYGELQSGRPESQTDWSVIEPFELIQADESWYPVPGLGGLTEGGPEVTMFADISAPAGPALRFQSNRPMDAMHVRVTPAQCGPAAPGCAPDANQPDAPLAERTFRDVRPGRTVLLELPANSRGRPIRVLATDPAGRVVLDYRDPSARPNSIICELYEHKAKGHLGARPTANELAVRAAAAYRAHDPARAEEYCRKALELDPGFGPAHRWLGFLLRWQGRADQAAEHLKAALLADPMDYAAYYLYAASLLDAGRFEQAAVELERVVGYTHGQYRAWAAVLLVRCLLTLGRTDEARQVMSEWPGEVAHGALGRAGYRVGLAPADDNRWWDDPADLFVRIVRAADSPSPLTGEGRGEGEGCDAPEHVAQPNHPHPVSRQAGRPPSPFEGEGFSRPAPGTRHPGHAVSRVLDEWWAGNTKDPDDAADTVLAVAEEFLDVGDLERARAVLTWLVEHPVLGAVCPMAHYRLKLLGEAVGGQGSGVGGVTDRAGMAWPARLTDGLVLAAACQAAPDDPLAHALRGMHQLWLGRADEAIGSLERATGLDPADALAWRNLGLARWTAERSWQECLDAYRRAIAIWPDYWPLVVEADRMLAEVGAPADVRRRLLGEDLHPSLAEDAEVAIRRARLALATGDYQAGLAELSGRKFHPAEGGFSTRHLFARLNVREGERLAAAGDWAGALACFRRSLEYPDNIGIGRPRRVQESRQRYLIGLALEKLGDLAGSKVELDELVRLCLRIVPSDTYFGILALRKLGQDRQADGWLAHLDRQANSRTDDSSESDEYWAKVFAAILARARGERDRSNRLLAELAPHRGDELTDYLNSQLY